MHYMPPQAARRAAWHADFAGEVAAVEITGMARAAAAVADMRSIQADAVPGPGSNRKLSYTSYTRRSQICWSHESITQLGRPPMYARPAAAA